MVYLTEEDLILILLKALLKAKQIRSEVGNETVRIHVAMQGPRRQKRPSVVFSHEGADEKLKEVARERAHMAERSSHHKLAVTSYGAAVQSGLKAPEKMAGGVPLYKSGKLVGSLAISGDSSRVDEMIAHSAAEDFSAPVEIRSPQTPFLSGSLGDVKGVEFMPSSGNVGLRVSQSEKIALPRSPRYKASRSKLSTSTGSSTGGKIIEMPSMKTTPPPTPAALSRMGSSRSTLPPSPRRSSQLPPSPLSLSSSTQAPSLPPSPKRMASVKTPVNTALPASPVLSARIPLSPSRLPSSPNRLPELPLVSSPASPLPPSPRKVGMRTLPKLK